MMMSWIETIPTLLALIIGIHESIPLLWRHNKRDVVQNHRHLDCLIKPLFRRRSKKVWELRVTGLCEGNPSVIDGFSSQMASNAENVSILRRLRASPVDTHHKVPVMWNFHVSSAVSLNNPFGEQSSHWYVKTPWRSCDTNMIIADGTTLTDRWTFLFLICTFYDCLTLI